VTSFPTPDYLTEVDEPGSLELLVKRYPNGKGSTYLHSLAPGSTVRFLAAIPGYKWVPNAFSHITLIAGGAGITPLYQLTRGILSNPEDKTKVTLIWGVSSDEDILLKEEFAELEWRFPGRFERIVTVSRPRNGSVDKKGYVTKALLEEVAGKEGLGGKVFVCGPPALEKALLGKGGILQELGVGKKDVHQF